MTARDIRQVKHTCGHPRHVDVAGKKPFEVDGWLSWLEKKPCPDCDPKFQAKRAASKAQWRKDQETQAQERERAFGWEGLVGPSKMVAWATQERVKLVSAAWESLGLDEDEFATLVGEPAGQVNAAGWWLDNREIEPEALPELLAVALGEPAQDGLENPF